MDQHPQPKPLFGSFLKAVLVVSALILLSDAVALVVEWAYETGRL